MANTKQTVDAKTYAKNVLRSAKYIAVETIKGVNPTLTEYVSNNVELSKDLYHDVKDFKTTVKNKLNSVLGETGFEDLKAVKSNVLSDLRTGKFYNPEREEANMDKTMANMGFSFNFDDIDFDVEDPEDEPETTESKSISTIADKISFSQQKSSEASAGIIVRGANKNTRATMAHTEKMFGTVNNSLAAINSSILNLHNDLATPINTHIVNSMNFYQSATQELAKQTSYLENMNKLLTSRFTPTSTNGFNNKKSDWEEVMGSGLPDLRKLGTVIKRKAIDESGLGMFSGMLSPEMVQMILGSGLGSPIALGISALLKHKMQNGPLGKSLENTVDILKGGSIGIATRIHEYNKKTRGRGLFGTIANLLDIVPEKGGNKLDFGKYNKGRADWTGKDSKALQDVIPTQLATIISMMSGKPALIFDYETGKWKNAQQVKQDFSNRRSANIANADNGYKNSIIDEFINEDKEENAGKNIPTYTRNSRAVISLSKDYDMLITLLATKGEALTEFKTASELIAVCNKYGWTKEPVLLDPVNLRTLARIIFKKKNPTQNLAGAIYAGRLSDKRFVNSNLGGTFANIANDSEVSEANSANGNLLTNTVDENKHNIFYYLSNILDAVRGKVHRKEIKKTKKGDIPGADQKQKNEQETKASTTSTIIDGWLIPGRESKENAPINDAEGRQVYNSETESYEDAPKPISSTRGTREKKEKEKSSLLSRFVDKINDGLESVMYGNAGKAIKEKYKEAGGLIGIVKDIPNMIEKITETIKEKVSGLWKKFKDSDFGKKFFGSMKESVVKFGKETWKYAKDTGSNIKNFVTSNTDWVADVDGSPMAAKGGVVRKSGMASVSEGEMIIPAHMNPNYKGNMTDEEREDEENSNFWKWMQDGAPGGDYFGSFRKGSKNIKAPKYNKKNQTKKKSIRDKILNLADKGNTDEEIAKILKINPREVARITRRHAAKETVKSDFEDVKEFVENKAEKVKGSEAGQKVKETIDKMSNAINSGIKHLFGEEEKYDNTKETTNKVLSVAKNNLPKTLASGTLGALIGAALTGSGIGLLGGFVVGAGTSILKNSDELSRKLFGTKEDVGGEYTGGKLPPKISKFIKERLPKTTKAAALGGILGTIGIAPGGILGGMVLGAGLELVSTTTGFKDLMLGKQDINGKRKGGIVGSIKANVIDPLAAYTKGGIEKISNFVKKEIYSPIKSAIKPFADNIKGKFLSVRDSMTNRKSNKVKSTGSQMFDSIFSPITNTISKVGKFGVKVAGGIVSAPAKLIGGIGNRVKYKNIKKGYSDLTPEERIEYMNNKKFNIFDFLSDVKDGVTGLIKDKIIDPTAKFISNTAKTIFGWFKKIGSKVAGFFKEKLIDPVVNFAKEKILNPVKDFINEKVFKPVKDFVKKRVIDPIKKKIIDPVKNKVKEAIENNPINKYNKWAVNNKDKILEAAQYFNGSNSFKRSQLEKRQNLANTITASLENGGMGNPALVKEINNLFNSKGVVDNNDFSSISNKIDELIQNGNIGSNEGSLLKDRISKIQGEISQDKINFENFDANREKFLKENGFDKLSKRDLKKIRIQSLIDAKNITGKSFKDLDDELLKARDSDKAEELLKQQEKENPIDVKRNNILTDIKSFVAGIAGKLNVDGKNVKSTGDSTENLDKPETATDKVNNIIPNANNGNSNSFEKIPEAEKGTTKTEFVDGHPMQYVYDGQEWNLVTSDADTKAAIEEGKTKSKFYEMFVGGGLLNSLKNVFSFDKKDKNGEEKESIFSKIAGIASNIFNKEDGVLSKIFNLFNGGGFITTLIGGLKTALPTILTGVGLGVLLKKIGEKSAGTGKDSGMYKGVDPESRKEEVSKYGVLKKAALGVDSLENTIRGRDTTTYEQDDFVTEYETSRIGNRMFKNALLSFNPKLAQKGAKVIKGTIGKIPIVGKATSSVIGSTANLADNTRKAAKFVYDKGSKIASSKVGQATAKLASKAKTGVVSVGKKLAGSKAGKAVGKATSAVKGSAVKIFDKVKDIATKSKAVNKVVDVAAKIKDKVVAVLKSLVEKLGLKGSDDVVEEAAEKVSKEVAEKGGSKLASTLAKAAIVLNVIFIANAVLEGFQKAKAKTILGILDEPTVGQRCLAAALNGLNEAIPGIGGIIPSEVLFSILYTVLKWMGCKFDKLDEQRANAKATVEAYNKENGTTYNIEEYIHNVLGEYTVQEKVGKAIKDTASKAWTGIKNFFSGKKKEDDSSKESAKKEKAEGSNLSNEIKANERKLNNARSTVKTTIVGAGSTVENILPTKTTQFANTTEENNKILSGISDDIDMTAEGSGLDLIGGASDTSTEIKTKNQEKSNSAKLNSIIDKMTKDRVSKVSATTKVSTSALSKFKSAAAKIEEQTKEKVSVIIPEELKSIGGKVSNLFENIGSEIPDVTNLIADLWKLSDPESKGAFDYDSVIAKYQPKDGSLMGGFGSSLVKAVGGVMRIINAVVSPFRFISSLVGGTVSKIASGIAGIVTGKTTTESNDSEDKSSGNIFTKTASKIKNAASSAWNWAKNLITGSGSDVEEDKSSIHTSQKGNFTKFGSTNIDKSGCGPAVASTVLKAYGKNVGINKAAKFAENHNYVAGSSDIGTKASYFSDILGSNGIKTNYIEDNSKINSSVKSGKPTILLGQDKSNRSKANSPFGPNPHYVVTRGMNKKGDIIVDDPELNHTTIYSKNILKHTKLGIATGGYSGVEELVSSAFGNMFGNVAQRLGNTPAGKILSLIFGSSSNEEGTNNSGETSITNSSSTENTNINNFTVGSDIFKKLTSLTGISSEYKKLYNNSSNGGISYCITGSPTNANYNVLSNCVGWACARFNHIYNLLTGYTGMKYPNLCCNAKDFIERAQQYGMTISSDPQIGAIMCWSSSTYGHVAVVEEVVSNDEVVTSESGWNSSKVLWNQNRKRGNGNWGEGTGYTFRGFIYNPGVAEYMQTHKSAIILSGSSDKQKIWNFILSKGLNEYAAAGIMGCFEAESNNRARIVEGDYITRLNFPGYDEYFSKPSVRNAWAETIFANYASQGISISKNGYKGSDGTYYPGVGLAQWTGERAYSLSQYAKNHNLDWGDLSTQLAFFWQEFTTNSYYANTYKKLQSVSSVKDATRIFALGFEHGGMKEDQIVKRQNYAIEIYNEFASRKSSTSGNFSSYNLDSNTQTAQGSGLRNFRFNSSITKMTGIPKSQYSIGGDSGLLKNIDAGRINGNSYIITNTPSKHNTRPISKKDIDETAMRAQDIRFNQNFEPIDFTKPETYKQYNTTGEKSGNKYTSAQGSGFRTSTHKKSLQQYNGGASGVSPSTSSNNSIIELNKAINYLKDIADNTKYNSAIPQIVELIGDSIEAISEINTTQSAGKRKGETINASSEAENYQNSLENGIKLMRAKLEAISKTL